jgi:hypothetical protein
MTKIASAAAFHSRNRNVRVPTLNVRQKGPAQGGAGAGQNSALGLGGKSGAPNN